MTALVLALTAATVGGRVFTIAAAVAIPAADLLGVALWLDRFEPEPRHVLAMAFLWGASVAILMSGVANGIMDAVGGLGWSAVAGAPVVEEVLKAASSSASTVGRGTSSTASSTA